ncbi:mitochondrial ribosomal protein subunit L20-domain-containing protein [Cyathus striatus]|nr:mitochondrial ribosomal protein subunit L20-domain-containing protein [Cyathus striatus]
MNVCRRLPVAPSLTRSYATRYPRPRPGTSERSAYHAPDPLQNNPSAVVTPLTDEGLTFIHRPPPTAPSPHSLTSAPTSPFLRPPTPVASPLPPHIRPSAAKVDATLPARMSDEDIAKLRQLRLSDPEVYTRGKLAEMFGCTENFVGLVAALKKPKRKALLKTREEAHKLDRAKWNEKHTLVKEIRAKRRQLW